jgi:hypothetical protein
VTDGEHIDKEAQMGLFDWLFGVGDEVEDEKGDRGRVRGFRPEGHVDVKGKDGKTRSKFGGNLKKVDTGDDSSSGGDTDWNWQDWG